MKPSGPLRFLFAALLLLAGCYKATFHQANDAIRGEGHEEWTDFFIFGLVGTETFDVREFCGGASPAEVRSGGNFLTGLVSAVTIGIYTPRKVYVTCAAAGVASAARRLELSFDGDGLPVRAVIREGVRTANARITPAHDAAFAVHVEQEVSP
jgi:hypothetical protein